MSVYLYYNRPPQKLEMYQRLIQYWGMTFGCGEKRYVLDNMNFNISIFPEIFSATEINLLHRIEPGYTSPDGWVELSLLIKELEIVRLAKNNPGQAAEIRKIIRDAGVGCGNGCTNVMNGVIRSIVKLSADRFANTNIKPEVVLTLPNYTVYDAQISNMNGIVTSKYIHAKRQNNFLPVLEEIYEAITSRTIAIIITYPNNPAQSTYEGNSADELKKIAAFCQKNKIFLIVDNIYQDVIFPAGRQFIEIFSLTNSLDYIVKVYGCSKDTPFYSGYRTGYWIGDPLLMENYKYYISSSENSLNTYSLVFFALNLYFKMKHLVNREPELDEMEFFSNGIFGWKQKVDKKILFDKLSKMDLFQKYKSRITISNSIQEDAIDKTIAWVKNSPIFIDHVNQRIGNVFFIKVNPAYFNKTDDEFFKFLFYEGKIAILPGNVFGIPESSGEVWFRITLLHEPIDVILKGLAKIEKLLKKVKAKNNNDN